MQKFKLLTIISAITLILSIGSAFAFFTGSDAQTNTFSVGEVSIELSEPNWDTSKAANMRQGEIAPKDPQVKNTGENQAYVFMEVKIPKRNIYTYNEAKERLPKAVTPLYSLDGVSSAWTLATTLTDDPENNTYVYAYGNAASCTKLGQSETTPALFTGIKYCNAVEGQGLDEEENLTVDVTAYAIQTENITSDDSQSPLEIWKTVKNQL